MPRKNNEKTSRVNNEATENLAERIVTLAFKELHTYWYCENPLLGKTIVNFPEEMSKDEKRLGTYEAKTPLKAVEYSLRTNKLYLDIDFEGMVYYIEADLKERNVDVSASYELKNSILKVELSTDFMFLDFTTIGEVQLYAGDDDKLPQKVVYTGLIPSPKSVLPTIANIGTTTAFEQECFEDGEISFDITDSRSKKIGVVVLLEKPDADFADALSELESDTQTGHKRFSSFVQEKRTYYSPFKWEQLYVAMGKGVMRVEL